jgi:hypothetical protein
MELKK